MAQATLCTPGPPPIHPIRSPEPFPGPPESPSSRGTPALGPRPGARTPASGDLRAPGPHAAPPASGASQRPFVPPSPGTLVPEKFQDKNRRERKKRRTRESGPGRWGRTETARQPKVSPPKPQGRGEHQGGSRRNRTGPRPHFGGDGLSESRCIRRQPQKLEAATEG